MPLPEINAWPVGDKVVTGMAIKIMEKGLCKGIKGRYHLKFNIVYQLQATVSYIYYAISMDQASRYSQKSHQSSVLHMYKGDMQSSLIEIFDNGMNRDSGGFRSE